MADRRVFFDASPLSYVTTDKNSTRFLLIYGREDDVADAVTQSDRFLLALKQAGFFARNIVVPGAGHFWATDPIDEPGSFGAYVAPKLLRFLEVAL
jgi:dipeptidyl aminopeptidase/acylaminoacyl peptidase